MYFITTKRMLEVCFSAHPNIQYRTFLLSSPALSYASSRRYSCILRYNVALLIPRASAAACLP